LERGITTLVTTHHPELKAFAHSTPGVVNASVEFDLDTLRPTYHLTIGLPGRSNALAIAQRLGLSEEIIRDARSELSPEDLRAEDLLNEIHQQRELSRQARAAAEQARQEVERLRADLSLRLEKIEDERQKVLETARLEGQEEIQALKEDVAEVRRALARARLPVEALQVIEEKVETLDEQVIQPVERSQPAIQPALRRAIRLGDRVRLRTLGTQGVVSALSEEEAEVAVGALRVRTRIADLELQPAGESGAPLAGTRQAISSLPLPAEGRKSELLPASPGMELDLRGQRAEDAVLALERYLDAAYLAGMPFVRIIHGKGTGRLRQVVRQALTGNAQVKSFEAGGEKEGGEGVTIARFET
jgi:DNA mismatch repair protein MutS2